MARVQEHTDSDGNVVLRWGDDGTEFSVSADDTPAVLRTAYRKAVAQGLARGDTVSDEVDRSVAREIQAGVGIRKDANGGLILAWWPSEEEADAISELVPGLTNTVLSGDLHLTLLYLAEPGWEEGDPRDGKWDIQLLGAVCKLFARRWSPCECLVGGIGRFVMEEDEDAVVLLVDCPDLFNLRRVLEDDLICHGAIPHTSALFDRQRHGWIPHITLAYVPKTVSNVPTLAEAVKFTVSNVTIATGASRVRYELDAYWGDSDDEVEPRALVQRARDAYALGKAGRVLSGKNLKSLKDAVAAMSQVIEDEEKRRLKDEEYKKARAEILKAIGGEKYETALDYVVTKSNDERRFTLGPLYAPNRKDAHGEYTDADTLQDAVWEWVRQSAADGRTIKLQHGDLGEVTVGEWVEVMSWPYEHTIKVRKSGEAEREIEMPAGTVYVGAVWYEDSWPLVKSGKLNGWSLGGKAVRVNEGVALSEMSAMGDAAHKGVGGTTPGDLAMIRAAVEAEAIAHDREVTTLKQFADENRGVALKLIDTISDAFHQKQPDVHVHLPEQNVTIQEDSGLTKILDEPE